MTEAEPLIQRLSERIDQEWLPNRDHPAMGFSARRRSHAQGRSPSV